MKISGNIGYITTKEAGTRVIASTDVPRIKCILNKNNFCDKIRILMFESELTYRGQVLLENDNFLILGGIQGKNIDMLLKVFSDNNELELENSKIIIFKVITPDVKNIYAVTLDDFKKGVKDRNISCCFFTQAISSYLKDYLDQIKIVAFSNFEIIGNNTILKLQKAGIDFITYNKPPREKMHISSESV